MWFVGEMNSVDGDKLLKGKENGTFLVRLNNNRNYVLSVVNKVIQLCLFFKFRKILTISTCRDCKILEMLQF